MNSITANQVLKAISIVYFLSALIEIGAGLYNNTSLTLVTRIATPVLLSVLYCIKSERRDTMFFTIMGLLLVSNVCFYFKTYALYFIGISTFILLRVTTLALVFKLTRKKNYLYILIATFPFLLIFFYLVSVTNDIPNYEFNILVIQSILISMLGGIAVVSYLQNDNRHNSWLLISTLLFIGLRFIVFIERYFLADINIVIYRPIEVVLNVFAFFTFYKFVTTAEIDDNEIKI
jgi:hypothetical protein